MKSFIATQALLLVSAFSVAQNVGIGTTSPQNTFHVDGMGPLARFGTGTTTSTYNYWYTGNDIGSYIDQRGNTTTVGSDKLRIQSSKSGNTTDYAQFIIDPNNGFSFLSTGTGNGNVGIGTNSPGYKLHISGAEEEISLQGLFATASNQVYMTFRNSASTRVGFVGDGSSGDNNIFLESDLGDVALATNGSSVLTATALGNVGIGTNTPTYKLSVTAAPPANTPVAFIENTGGTEFSDGLYIKAGSNTVDYDDSYPRFIKFLRPDGTGVGQIGQDGDNSVFYATTSDKRLKNIIGASQKGLPDLMKINIYDYSFKSDLDKKVQTGFIAQELYEIFPQAVGKPRENNEPAEKNPWMVDYGRVTPLIIRSVQEQQKMIDEQNKKIEILQKENAVLKSMQADIEMLKTALAAKR